MYIHTKDQFGPDFWSVMEELAIGYPVQASADQQASMKLLFSKLAEHFPCKECAVHFQEGVSKMPQSALQGRKSLLNWVINFHNSVNARRGKPELSMQDALQSIGTKYKRREDDATELQECRTNKSNQKSYVISSAVICFLVAIMLAYGVKACSSKTGKLASGIGAASLCVAAGLSLAS